MSYIMKHFVCLHVQYRSLYSYVKKSLQRQPSPEEWRFLCHVLVSTLLKKENGYIPIYCRTISKALGQSFSWRPLYDTGLLLFKDYYRDTQDCREFSIPKQLVETYFAGAPFSQHNQKKVNLFTGRASKGKLKSDLYDESRNPEPPLIVNAIKAITDCPFNRPAILKHLEESKSRAEAAEGAAATSLYARYRVDLFCFQAIDRDSIHIHDHIYSYNPTYSISMSGRIYEKFGGLQACSRNMKAIAFQDIPDIHNYDLVSSQAYGMAQQFQQINLDTSWIFNYLHDKEAKKRNAQQIGISVQCWKDCLYAVFFGASVNPRRPHGSIYDILCHEFNVPLDDSTPEYTEACSKVGAAYLSFSEAVKPVTEPLSKWHNWLVTDYLSYTSYYGDKGHEFVKNKTGKVLDITSIKEEAIKKKDWSLVKRKLAAFVLQGFEATFIHNLSELAEAYGYRVLNNQHDGLLTAGEIPPEAIKLAAERSGMLYPYLEEKPLA